MCRLKLLQGLFDCSAVLKYSQLSKCATICIFSRFCVVAHSVLILVNFTKANVIVPDGKRSLLCHYIMSNGSGASCIPNILGISTKPIPLCPPSFAPTSMPNSTPQAPLLLKFAYLGMVFIFPLMHTASVAWQLKIRYHSQTNFVNSCAKGMEFCLFGGREDDEHTGFGFVGI